MNIKSTITLALGITFYSNSVAQVKMSARMLAPGVMNGSMIKNLESESRGTEAGGNYYNSFYQNGKLTIFYYSGRTFFKLPDIQCLNPELYTVFKYHDTVIVSGYFPGFNSGANRNILLFTGSKWDTAKWANISILSFETMNKELYGLGVDGSLWNLKLNGSKTIIRDFSLGAINSLVSVKNKTQLYILNVEQNFGYRYNGTTIDSFSYNGVVPQARKLVFHDTVIYTYSHATHKLSRITGLSAVTVSTISAAIAGNDGKGIAQFGSDILIGDHVVYRINSSTIDTVSGIGFLYGINSVGSTIYGLFRDTAIKTQPKTVVYEIHPGGIISGRIFWDSIQDCAYKPINNKGPFRCFAVTDSDSSLFYTDDSGRFEMGVDSGRTHIVTGHENLGQYRVTCGNTADTLINSGMIVTNWNVPCRFINNYLDCQYHITAQRGYRARQGFTENYTIVCRNKYAAIGPNYIWIKYPDSVTFIGSSSTPMAHIGKKIRFAIPSIAAMEQHEILLQFKIDTLKSIKGLLHFTISADSIWDYDTTNNFDTLTQVVVAAYDPNVKLCSPEGIIQQSVNKIEYHVHFENEGTDTAFNVIVRDTFIPNFPLNRLQMISSSFPYRLSVLPGNVLEWEFKNIKLPPKSENAQNSQGYFSFEAPLNAPMQKGQIIKNKVSIYFDYQKPVITPEAWIHYYPWGVSIKSVTKADSEIHVFPNPAATIIHLHSDLPLGLIQVVNPSGALVLQKTTTALRYDLDIANLADGLYFVILPEKGVKTRIIKQFH